MLESTMLVISDEPSLIEALGEVARSIEALSLDVLPAMEGAYAYESWDSVVLVVVHLRHQGPTSDIARLLRMISAARRPVATLVIGDPAVADRAPSLLRLGVADYLTWPGDVAWLAYLVELLTVRMRLASPASIPDSPRRAELDLDDSIFGDEAQEADHLMSQVRRVAPQDATILLSGETGTGKSRLARLIHDLSHRRPEPFVVINCGAHSAGQVEGEMFGQVRGSLAGAEQHDQVGKFAEVGRGTLFLDEIDTLPMAIQSKLLRVVEDRIFEPVGSGKSLPVRARLIAASNRLLDQEVAAQRFRSDLYYRLHVIGFHLPPLRSRRGAIPALVSTFLREFASRDGGKVEIAEEALEALAGYDWPGNIRELRNLVERSVALCPGREIRVADLPDWVLRRNHPPIESGFNPHPALAAPSVAHTTLAQIKRDAELARITEALQKHSNNRLRAASELGISRMTLYKKLYKYGLMQSGVHGEDSKPAPSRSLDPRSA